MSILHRYIQRNVIAMTFLVVLIITGLQTFISLINEMGSLGRGHYHALEAFVFVLLSLPHTVYPLFPVAVLIASLIALGRLASQSELIVMRTSGVSKAQITLSVIRTAILMLVFATFVGEFLAPNLQNKAANYKKEAITEEPISDTKEGGWIRDGESFIHINHVLADGKLAGILRYQFHDDRLISAATAKSAVYHNHQWVLKKVSETKFHENSTEKLKYDEQIWPVSFDPKLIGLGDIQSEQTSLIQLYHYIQYLKKGGLSAKAYE